MDACYEDMMSATANLGCFGSEFAPGVMEEGVEDFTDERFEEGYTGGEFDDFGEFGPPPPPEDI
jgi:hypothetical protein